MGSRHMIAAGHYLAALAGFEVLEAGGNAIDAGVCAGLAISVLESAYVSFGGVAPMVIRLADTGRVFTISGLGCWPRAASCEFFQSRHGGVIPRGILRTVVPAAPDAWLTALRDHGTMSFRDVSAAAIRFARDGFAMYPLMADTIAAFASDIAEHPSSAAIYLPNDAPPVVGRLFKQADLAATLQYMADEEAAVGGGRGAAIDAARNAFYRGDIAATMAAYHRANDGWLTMEDLAAFRSDVEPAVRARFADIDIYGCGPWCQGPMLLQALNLLDGMDVGALGHNSAAYVHLVTEAIKLAAADREAYYGDPHFVAVPMERLLSSAYAAERRRLIDPAHAFADLPPPGNVGQSPASSMQPQGQTRASNSDLDTSYVCVVDRHGNAFSATPSDGLTGAPVIPGLGFVPSPRGSQSWVDPAHPACVMPGKRPRLTPNPAIAVRDGEFVMPFGTPGQDTQTQVMLQVFLNLVVFGMDLQAAVEAPRFASLSFPSSSSPHKHVPGRLLVEAALHAQVGDALRRLGHRAEQWPDSGADYFMNISAACAVMADTATGVIKGAADPRRPAYAIGW
jgi:gamma-glutamyltranspeptidase / glutathione hydrolase